MKILLKTCLLFSACSLGTAQAVTISVNFQGRSAENTSTPPLATTTVAGAVAVDNWNNIDNPTPVAGIFAGTTGGLNDSAGGVTAVTLTYSARDSWRDGGGGAATATGNQQMTFGFIKTNSTTNPATFSFNNLPTTLYNYDLYLYGVVNNSSALGPNATFSVTGGPSKTLNEGPGSQATLTEDIHYVKLSGTKSGDLAFSMSWPTDEDGSPGGIDGAALAGVQLVYTLVPEPASVSLLGLGAGLLAFRRRR